MSVRLIITTTAVPGKGDELFAVMRERCRQIMQEPGCEQFEIFQSALDPDRLVTLELWENEASLAQHAALMKANPSNTGHLRADAGQREDYTFNRTR
jgi:quinol monooxygenase YgiN